MTIDEVVRASMSLHLSYGKYVEAYRPGLDKPSKKPERVCKRCGADISDRANNAIYCKGCAYIAALERQSRRRKEERKRNKDNTKSPPPAGCRS